MNVEHHWINALYYVSVSTVIFIIQTENVFTVIYALIFKMRFKTDQDKIEMFVISIFVFECKLNNKTTVLYM